MRERASAFVFIDPFRYSIDKYSQIWKQLKLSDGVLWREYQVNGFGEVKSVVVVPTKMKQIYLQKCHGLLSAGHQGWQKTLDRLKSIAYWIGMATDVKDYCRSCNHCVPAKQSLPPKVPLVKFPIGEPWKRIAMDVLEVPLNSKGNRYILVVQDYFTKWLEAFPMANQRAETIVEMLAMLAIHFCRFGIPQELHSDQGRNFESILVSSLCNAFAIKKTRTSAYHPQGDGLVERSNRILLDMLRSYVQRDDWEKYLPFMLYAYNTSIHSSTKALPLC